MLSYFDLIEVIVPGNIYMVYLDSEQKNKWTFWKFNKESRVKPLETPKETHLRDSKSKDW